MGRGGRGKGANKEGSDDVCEENCHTNFWKKKEKEEKVNFEMGKGKERKKKENQLKGGFPSLVDFFGKTKRRRRVI